MISKDLVSVDALDIMIEAKKILEKRLDIAVEALKSISKNGCCDLCQQAKLVALSALRKINTGSQPGEGKE